MARAGAAKRTSDADDLFDRIGAFLADHRLSCDPATYALIHAVLSQPRSALALEIARLTDGGVRLSRKDVERLGGKVTTGDDGARRRRPAVAEPAIDRDAARLVSETQAQVDGFAAMMRALQHETRGFGRDLAESAAAIRSPAAVADVARIAGAMVARVRETEHRLAEATEEADALRAKLADAHATARRDPLTGLPNRLAFAEAYVARSAADAPHCIALCDVDRFKRVNDEHGHNVGDRVLHAIGQALADACDGHLVARHGGEEFAVLIAGDTLADAARRLDAAREQVGAKRFRNRDTGASLGMITFSAGITAVRADEPAEQATERADRLLYLAKSEGRDRVCAG